MRTVRLTAEQALSKASQAKGQFFRILSHLVSDWKISLQSLGVSLKKLGYILSDHW